MATGSVTVFDEALWELLKVASPNADSSTYKMAVLKNTVTPVSGAVSPTLASYVQVTSAGNYIAGGQTVSFTWSQAGGIATFALASTITWLAHPSNDTEARWLLVYDTASGRAILFIDLKAMVDMTGSPLVLSAGPIFTLIQKS